MPQVFRDSRNEREGKRGDAHVHPALQRGSRIPATPRGLWFLVFGGFLHGPLLCWAPGHPEPPSCPLEEGAAPMGVSLLPPQGVAMRSPCLPGLPEGPVVSAALGGRERVTVVLEHLHTRQGAWERRVTPFVPQWPHPGPAPEGEPAPGFQGEGSHGRSESRNRDGCVGPTFPGGSSRSGVDAWICPAPRPCG